MGQTREKARQVGVGQLRTWGLGRLETWVAWVGGLGEMGLRHGSTEWVNFGLQQLGKGEWTNDIELWVDW